MISPAIIRLVCLAILGIVCIVTVSFGIRSGVRGAQTETVLKNAKSLEQAISFFYQDNNRYPTVSEFSSGGVMSAYVSSFPPHEFASGVCTKSYSYKSPTQSRFELAYCIPSGSNNLVEGWQTVSK